MDSSSEFETQSTAFLDWFKAQPGTQFHPSLKIVDLRDRNAGRGIIATQDIAADTDLFTIPRDIIISEETSTLAKKLPELFSKATATAAAATANTNVDIDDDDDDDDIDVDDESDPSVPDSWLNLILILLYESLHHTTSQWLPYLSILPQRADSFNTLMFWTDGDLSALKGSAMLNKIGKESANRMFTERIIPVVRRHADIFYPGGDSQQQQQQLSDSALLERCHIIGSLIMSYAFDLQPDEDEEDPDSDTEMAGVEEDGWIEDRAAPGAGAGSSSTKSTMGMVPMADMLNADAEFNAHLSHGDDSLTMTSLREIKAGEEVLNYYGPLPNGELLRRYGYTSPKHARYDVVEIPWSLVKTVTRGYDDYLPQSQTQKRRQTQIQAQVDKILDEIERDEDNRLGLDLDLEFDDGVENDDSAAFVLERDSGDPDDQGLCVVDAKFVSFPEDMVNVVGHVVTRVLSSSSSSTTKPSKSKKDEAKRIKGVTLDILKTIVLRRLELYPTTLAEDENLLLNTTTTIRERMAVNVRLGEKRLLAEALEWTESKLTKYRD